MTLIKLFKKEIAALIKTRTSYLERELDNQRAQIHELERRLNGRLDPIGLKRKKGGRL